MKRGGPLRRVTPLRRSSTLARTGPLKPRSAKQAALYRTVRVPLVVELLESNGPQRCEFPHGCTEQATTLHELLGRAQGGSITDRSNIRLACVFHNGWAEDHPTEAERIGWKLQRRHAA